jgi:hypothetical protein
MISNKHKCLFIHIPKTAGQSVERIFLSLNGLDWENRSSLLLKKNTSIVNAPPRLSHLTAAQYVSLEFLSPTDFMEYYKFSVVRNPWDRVVSIYKYLQYNRFMGFEQFIDQLPRLRKVNPMFFMDQWDYLYVDGQIAVNRICRFENLQNDFDKVMDDLGIPRLTLPHTNKDSNANTSKLIKAVVNDPTLIGQFMVDKIMRHNYDTSVNFTAKSVRAIEQIYIKDIKAFNYTFTER